MKTNWDYTETAGAGTTNKKKYIKQRQYFTQWCREIRRKRLFLF